MMLLSIIKESIRRADESYFSKIFEKRKEKMKPFVTAAYLHNFNIEGENIYLDELSVTVSSPDQEFMFNLYNGLLKSKNFKYRDITLKRNGIRPIREKEIYSRSVTFKTMSPILIEDKYGNPVSPYSSDYSKQVNYFADLILQNYRNEGLVEPLSVAPIEMKKQVVKENNSNFENNLDNQVVEKKLFYTTYKGLLGISGSLADLNSLYQLGLSKRRSQGFGLLELEREGV
ncbi:MAG: CRISPR-associated endoribonuclease Cas6 [Clostridiales bacterium]|nr:CRISPR-associated endoribonuclease Cas6 [Clostridiales bacterium]MCF8023309.1 CRISPR-associated endoribonuclease Cas6 [Clostridiales bacterium]